jgi:hypothetical protein
MRVKCLEVIQRPFLLENNSGKKKKRKYSLALSIMSDLGEKKEFPLNNFLEERGWISISGKMIEALKSTKPDIVSITSDGVVNLVDLVEWYEDAEELYRQLIFPFGFFIRLKGKIENVIYFGIFASLKEMLKNKLSFGG